MTTATEVPSATLLTADEFMRLSHEVHGELIRGVLCEMPRPGPLHGQVVALLAYELVAHAKAQGLGTVFADVGVLLERDPDTVRAPDVAFASHRRLPPGKVSERYGDAVPELVAEVVSPSDRHAPVRDKARMWLEFGAQLVWVVYPVTRTVEVHRVGTDAVETLTEADHLDGGTVLPGFSCPLSRLFAD